MKTSGLPCGVVDGLTVLELLVVLVVLAILLTVLCARHDPGALLLNRAGSELQVFLQQARLDAIQRNLPVLVEFTPTGLQSCVDQTHEGSCGSGDVLLHRWTTEDYGVLTYRQNLPTQLVWTPDGLPRQLESGFAAGTIVLKKQQRRLKVVLSAAGRLRME